MINLTENDREKFKNIVNKQYISDIKYVNIIVLNDVEDIKNYLLVNNTSFNYLIDKDDIYNLVEEGWATNGGYKLKHTTSCNPAVEHITIGLITNDILNFTEQLLHLSNKLLDFAITKKVRLAINNNIIVLIPEEKSFYNKILYKKINNQFVIDTIFKYFRSLFMMY